jgi:hypothetical protein
MGNHDRAFLDFLSAPAAHAQRRAGMAPRNPGAEAIDLTGYYGWMWGGSIGTSLGTLRQDSAETWGLALDIPVDRATWIEVSYGHQGSKLVLDRRGQTDLAKMGVDFWQIGGVRGLPRGNLIPYLSATLGLTHYSPDGRSVVIEGNEYALDSATKFSISLGAGLKAFFGEQERVGLRAQFRLINSIYSSGTGIWFGTGGAGVSFNGWGVWNYEVAGGLVVRLGK